MRVETAAAMRISDASRKEPPQENLKQFIEKKREMFLLQYSLNVKRDEMKKLDNMSQEVCAYVMCACMRKYYLRNLINCHLNRCLSM